MVSEPRIQNTVAVYHVMLGGNRGAIHFFYPKDSSQFEQLIVEGPTCIKCQIHGYCWMPNHVHMVVAGANIPLFKIIQNLSFRYIRRNNYLSRAKFRS